MFHCSIQVPALTVSRPPFDSFNIGRVHNKLLFLGVIGGGRLKPSDVAPFSNKSTCWSLELCGNYGRRQQCENRSLVDLGFWWTSRYTMPKPHNKSNR